MSNKGWKTVSTKDGKQVLDRPFYATNPRYIEVHNSWNWQEVPYQEALREMESLQLADDRPGYKCSSSIQDTDKGGKE